MELPGKRVYSPVLKTTLLSARAQNHASPERCHKSFTIIFLSDHDFPLTGSNFGNLTAFKAIFSHIFTATAIYELPVKVLTSSFDSLIPISLYGRIFPRYEDVFC